MTAQDVSGAMYAIPPGFSPSWASVRIARPVRDLESSTRFYRDLLGLAVVGGFLDHEGYDGLFFRLPGGGELELTVGGEDAPSSTDEDLLVLYLRTWREAEVIADRLLTAGVPRLTSPNPYWNRWGRTFRDPDGYRVVVAVSGGEQPGPVSDAELYRRGHQTLLASFEDYARGSVGGRLQRLPGVAVAVFAHGPESGVYNNAVLEHGMGAARRAEAVDAMEAAYRAAGVRRFAAWVHETDAPMRTDLERRGYSLDITTRAMGMSLAHIRLPRPEIELGPADWPEYLASQELPPDFLATADHAAFHALVARIDGEIVAAALAYDVDGDCGIYNVGTAQRVRRRGLGTAVAVAQLYNARARGCRTASLQSTPMAERVYAAAGFRDLGRILEFVPPGA
jgi:catechol 2,3-dioxygenase-like lactoylglutathione lyase family enzyme